MKTYTKIITIIIFFVFITSMPIQLIISKKKEFSEAENRNLAKLPEFSFDSVMDRSYMKGLDNYISDHFIARPNWIGLKTTLELSTGKREINNVFITKNRLMDRFGDPNYIEVSKSIDAINHFAKVVNKEVYAMIVPTSVGIYRDMIPSNAPVNNQKLFIDYVNKKLNRSIVDLNSYDALNVTKNEYIYYNTDHHWTSLGAYYAYASSIEKMGFEPIPLNFYDIEHASSSFYGTIYSKVLKNVKPDTIDFYHYNNGPKILDVEVNDGINVKHYPSMYFMDYLNKKDKYSSFLGPNQPSVKVTTDIKKGKNLLVIKDSYAHCFIPFLTTHYSQIQMIDLRYIRGNINQYVNMENVDQILFLYNAKNFSQQTNIKKLQTYK